jgi:hypothetical protein
MTKLKHREQIVCAKGSAGMNGSAECVTTGRTMLSLQRSSLRFSLAGRRVVKLPSGDIYLRGGGRCDAEFAYT